MKLLTGAAILECVGITGVRGFAWEGVLACLLGRGREAEATTGAVIGGDAITAL